MKHRVFTYIIAMTRFTALCASIPRTAQVQPPSQPKERSLYRSKSRLSGRHFLRRGLRSRPAVSSFLFFCEDGELNASVDSIWSRAGLTGTIHREVDLYG